jgi:putative flippase GtrA
MLRIAAIRWPMLPKAASWLHPAPDLGARAIRYALVGLANGAVFATTGALAVSQFQYSPVAASALGYLFSVPMSFVGHRRFTFQSNNAWKGEAGRFILVHVCSLSAAVLIMQAVTGAQLPYYLGFVGAVLLIPLINFLVSHFWVFATRSKGE